MNLLCACNEENVCTRRSNLQNFTLCEEADRKVALYINDMVRNAIWKSKLRVVDTDVVALEFGLYDKSR